MLTNQDLARIFLRVTTEKHMSWTIHEPIYNAHEAIGSTIREMMDAFRGMDNPLDRSVS